jgi:hypothetical protein
VIGQLAPIEEAPAKDDAEDGLVLHPRHDRADSREACTADVDGGHPIGSGDTSGVVVGIERGDVPDAIGELA